MQEESLKSFIKLFFLLKNQNLMFFATKEPKSKGHPTAGAP